MTAAHQPWMDSPWFERWISLARQTALLLACVWSVEASVYYVSTTGSSVNPGTLAQPWSLQYALTNATVAAGDTVYVRGGTYIGSFNSTLTDATLRAYGSERATIDGVLAINGSGSRYQGLEVFNSSTDRVNVRATSIDVFGPNTKLINLVVHDGGSGIGFWTPAINAEIYGCIVYNNGYQDVAPDRGHGHGIYAQNDTGTKLISDNILFNNYAYGLHIYTVAGSIQGFNITGNISFGNGSLASGSPRSPNFYVAGETAADRVTLTSNYGYHVANLTPYNSDSNVEIGSLGGPGLGWANNGSLTAIGNYLAGGLSSFNYWTNATVTGNQLICTGNKVRYTTLGGSVVINTNVYYPTDGAYVAILNGTSKDLAGMQALGYEVNGTLAAGYPTSTVYFVRPNSYETGRGHVAVYNWAGSDNVSVDLSSVCQSGRSYAVKNAANYYGPTIKTFAYASSPVSMPMTNLTVATPMGGSAPSATGPTFNAFIIEPTATIKTRGFLRKR